jgi:hypothetical protein
MKSRKSRKNTKKQGGALTPARSSFGELILRKGMRLYHTSVIPLCVNQAKPMLFLTLHPSEWYTNSETHAAVIELQRDVSLFFMIHEIRNFRVFSHLSNLTGAHNNLSKMNNDNLRCYTKFLKKENFDGWISSIENKTAIEIALINDTNVYKIIECEKLKNDWRNSDYNDDGQIIPKNWGQQYPIFTKQFPAKLTINIRFKENLEKYVRDMKQEDPNGTAFAVLLENAEITYINAPIQNIKWC